MRAFKNTLIVHHSATWTSLVEEELFSYLKNKSNTIFYVTHPFKDARDKLPLNTTIKIYKKGTLVRELRSVPGIGPEIFFFIKDFLFTVLFFLIRKGKIDLYFGVDNLNAFSGIVLKKLGKVNKVVYYVIDYVPYRFNNSILNKIYHWVDFYCVKNADQTWNLSSEMANARVREGLNKKYLKKQITVPVGCHPLRTRSKSVGNKIVFLGNLTKDQGVNLLIDSMPEIIRKFSNTTLIIIGSGKEEKDLKEKVKALGLEHFIEFRGFMKDNIEVNKVLASCDVGVAPYILSRNSFKYYTDPGKIKTYFGAGLPIIMTNISHVAKVIQDKEAGLIVEDSKVDISKAIIKIFSDNKLYSKLKNNAIKLSEEFAWSNIFNKAFLSLERDGTEFNYE